MGKWLALLEQWLGGGPDGGKKANAVRWIVLLGLAGAVLIILNSFITVKQADRSGMAGQAASPPAADGPEHQAAFTGDSDKEMTFRDYENMYETRMKEILEKIVGVGDVDVLVTIDSIGEIDVEKNNNDTQQVTNEEDQNGAKRHISEVTRNDEVVLYEVSGGQSPIVLKKIMPKIRGVLVVARGAENPTVKNLIVDAVERGLAVPRYRISVVPRKQQ